MSVTVDDSVTCMNLGRPRRRRADVRDRPAGSVPAHLRDARYKSARTIGHGVGYDYPHDDPRGWGPPQEHRPSETAGRVYHEPSAHGEEPRIEERMRAMRTEGRSEGRSE